MSKLVECQTTGTLLPEAQATELDELSKGLPSGCEYRTKALHTDVQFEPGERAEVSILSANSVDNSNEVVLPQGIRLERFNKTNRPVYWNHDQTLPCVGNCQWIKIHKNTLRGKTIYPERVNKTNNDSPFWLDSIWDLMQVGLARAKSIGFKPLKPLREPTHDELAEHPEWKGAGIWDDIELVEYSCVNVGCCDDAILEAINSKSINEDTLNKFGVVRKSDPRKEIVRALREQHKADELVCNKIQELYDTNQDAKFTAKQIVAIAQALVHAKQAPVKPKKKVDINKVIAKALDNLKLDTNKIAWQAIEAYRNRGRV